MPQHAAPRQAITPPTPPPLKHPQPTTCYLRLRVPHLMGLNVNQHISVPDSQATKFQHFCCVYFQNIFIYFNREHIFFFPSLLRIFLMAHMQLMNNYLGSNPRANPFKNPTYVASSMAIHIADLNYSIHFYLFLIF